MTIISLTNCKGTENSTGKLLFHIEPLSVDTLLLGSPSYVKIRVENMTKENVTISDHKVSCSCSELSLSTNSIKPESSIILTLKIIPDSTTQNQQNSITAVIKTDLQPQIYTLNYSYFVLQNNHNE